MYKSIKFRCSNLDGSQRSDFKTVGIDTNNGDVYSTSGSHFCGIRSTDGLLGLDLMLCESYNCKDSLTTTANSLEDRTYKVVPGNTDFEQPAIEMISVRNVAYDQT